MLVAIILMGLFGYMVKECLKGEGEKGSNSKSKKSGSGYDEMNYSSGSRVANGSCFDAIGNTKY